MVDQTQKRDQFGAPALDWGRVGNNSSTSSSTSTPISISTKENEIINALSGVAAGLANRMVDWANGVFATTSKITDQAVGNFFQVSQQMGDLSNNLTSQYNDVFAPQNRQLAHEANVYNSESRIKSDMGAAGATQAQAGADALRNSEEALRSYGINPSDGRYAALEHAASVQNAANVAGAMNMQRDRTAQVGRDLRTQAVQVGAQLPAAIANVNNTAIQANTGASNATLANANTGRNLQALPNDYLRTAMDVKLPPTGQNSQSQSQGTGSSRGGGAIPDGGGSRASGGMPRLPGGGGGGFGGSGPGAQAWMPQHGNAQASYMGGGRQQYQPRSAIMRVPQYDSAPDFSGYDDVGSQAYGGSYDDISGMDFSGYGYDDYTGGSDSSGSQSYGSGFDDISGFDYSGYGSDDYSGSQSYGSGFDDYSGMDFSGYGYDSFDSYDTTSPSSDYYAGDYDNFGGYEDMGGAFAKGGAVDMPRGPHTMPDGTRMGGGQVPPHMSPSGGRMVDDVPAVTPQGPARLNADEFVIPRDVALWKGQEFFQKLIEQSRSKRMTAPAPGGQPPGPPRQNPPMR